MMAQREKESFLGRVLSQLRHRENPPQNREDVARQLGERWKHFGDYPILPSNQENPDKLGLLWAVAILRAMGKIEGWVDNQPAFDNDNQSLPTHKAFYIRETDPLNPPPAWGF